MTTNELPVFELERNCLYEGLSWDGKVSPMSAPAGESSPAVPPHASATACAMSSRSTPPSRLPQLPLEIWTIILTHITDTPDDLCRTWLNLRRVSRVFNAAIETAVRNGVLRCADIAFPVHRTKVVFIGKKISRIKLGTIVARLDHLSEDGERVFFRDSDALERMGGELLNHTLKSWSHTIQVYVGDADADYVDSEGLQLADYDADVSLNRDFNFSQPPHVITLGGMVNDSELPGLEVDFDRLEISFNWRRMLTMFLAEDDRVRRLERTTKVSAQCRRFRVDKGGLTRR